MHYETIQIERRGAAEWVTLHRPETLNALNRAMIDELSDYFGNMASRNDVRLIVLRGAGRGFCSGFDMKQGQEQILAEREDIGFALEAQARLSRIIERMRACPQPIIALVHGAACGGGFSLALAADIRLAGESSRMNAAYVKLGLGGCDLGTSYFLPRIVGAAIAAELIYTGRFIDARRAERLGLVSEVTADDGLEAAAQGYVDDMLATAPLGLRLSKDCLNFTLDAPSLQAALAMENRNQLICSQTADFLERAAGTRK